MSDTSHPQTPVAPTASPESPPAESPPAKSSPSAVERIKGVLGKLGPVGIFVYMSLTALFWIVSMMLGREGLERLGFELPAGAGTATLVTITWGLSKATQAVRIAVALVLTPLVAKIPFVAKLAERFSPSSKA